MGRSVFAEECLLEYLTTLSDLDGYTVGLILGQSTDQHDYVIHLARTPPPAPKDVIEENIIGSSTNIHQESPVKVIKSVKDVPSCWVADHALHVTRMLPGGMSVLGVFVVGPSDSLSDNDSTQRLKSMITAINKNFESHPHLYGNNSRESLIFAFNSLTKKFICKSFDITSNTSLKTIEWKFPGKITKWYQLETRVDFDHMFPVFEGKESETLKEQLQNILKDMSDRLNSSVVIIEGDKRPFSDSIEVIGNKKKRERKESKRNDSDVSDKSLQAAIYVPYGIRSERGVEEVNCSASMRLVGQIGSRTFVHQECTVQEASEAVKQDIMRSLASRLEMHWDSLLEEENELPEDNVTLHELPRRVLVALPQSRITLSDYLFPGEGPQEALLSLQELLDLEVQESSVQKELELQVDPTEFYSQNEIKNEQTDPKKFVESNQFMIYSSGLAAGLLFLLAALIIHYLY